jgi:hypothetical protein
MSSFEDFKKKIEKLTKNASLLEGDHVVALTDLLTPEFVSKHTEFANAEALFSGSSFKIEAPEDFAAIPDEEWDAYIRSVSGFADWKSMMRSAVAERTKRKLHS